MRRMYKKISNETRQLTAPAADFFDDGEIACKNKHDNNSYIYMIILLGSDSAQKIGILQGVLEDILEWDFGIIPLRVSSGISQQPLSREETREGAINRARRAAEGFGETYHHSFGLEAGLESIDGLYHFISVAAIAHPDGSLKVGESDPMPLPGDASERVACGEYLGSIIRGYRELPSLSAEEKEAVEDLINRRRGFVQAVRRAWGDGAVK